MAWVSFDEAVDTRPVPAERAQLVSDHRSGDGWSDEQILSVITRWVKEKGYSPTVRELCAAIGCTSTSVVAWHIDKLEMAGCITRTRGITRSIRPVVRSSHVCTACGGSGRVEESS